jgi:hypothetical protein
MNQKLPFIIFFSLMTSAIFGQKDSSVSQHQLFFSFNLGIPVYNSFNYSSEQTHLLRSVNSKRKPSLNFSFEHNIEHFTINLLFNYSFNEFEGEPYYSEGAYIRSNTNQEVYKSFEIYQTVKYNYLAAGLGLGYNRWIKKHNLMVSANFQKNIFTDIILSTNYTSNAIRNNQDTADGR